MYGAAWHGIVWYAFMTGAPGYIILYFYTGGIGVQIGSFPTCTLNT